MCSSDLLEVCLSAFLGNFGELMNVRKSDQEWRGQRARGSRKFIFRANFI